MIVTDTLWKNKSGELKKGFYMDGYLCENLSGIPSHLKKDWDVVGIVSGSGKVRVAKCQVKGDLVLMKDGSWKKIEKVNVGDQVISPQKDGSFKYVKVVNTHHRFEKEVFLVKENKSGKVLYACAGNHLIPVYRPQSKRYLDEDGKEKRKTIKKLDLYDSKKISNLYIKQSKITSFSTTAIEFEHKKDSNIEPYSLGAYLGDGSFSVRKIKSDPRKEFYFTQGHYRKMKSGKKVWQEGHYCKNGHKHYQGFRISRSLRMTSVDMEIMEEISKYYPVTKIYSTKNKRALSFNYSLNGEFAKELIRLNLDGKGSGTKFIPKECLLSSINYRLRLLAGLIDTDGSVSKNNHISITTKSKKLSEDILNLVFSLGGYSQIKKIKGKCGDFVGEYYKVNVSFKDPTIIPIFLKRKRDRLRQRQKDPRKIGIECVQTNSQKVYGIEIEGESKWYVTNNWMVTHNSTIAMQSGFFVAWLLAGGKICFDRESPDYGKVIKTPTKEVNFDLKKNVVFDVGTLMKRGYELPPNSIIVYDEGREGLDAKSTMMNINRSLENFFQECGVYNHVILVVLPDFFALNKTFATARSNFLINTYIDEKYNRGYFSFYSEKNKENLYEFGRRKLGSFAKYSATNPNFRGKFTKWLPFSKKEYDNLKKEALKRKRLSNLDIKLVRQRDMFIYLYKNESGLSGRDISKEVKEEFGVVIGKDIVQKACVNTLSLKEKKSYADEIGLSE